MDSARKTSRRRGRRQGATEVTVKDFEGKAGLLLWKFDARAVSITSTMHRDGIL
jgi:hypothetical protein